MSPIPFFEETFIRATRISGRLKTRGTPYFCREPIPRIGNKISFVPCRSASAFPSLCSAYPIIIYQNEHALEKKILILRRFTTEDGVMMPLSDRVFFRNNFLLSTISFFILLSDFRHVYRAIVYPGNFLLFSFNQGIHDQYDSRLIQMKII